MHLTKHAVSPVLLSLVAITVVGCATQPRADVAATMPPRASVSAADSAAAARAVEAVVADSFFAAVARFDAAAITRAVTPAFELEEDTLRLTGPSFVTLVRSFEGRATIRYRLDGFNTRVAGATAWTSYRNHGTMTLAGATTAIAREWLETAVLVRDASGIWRVDRMHSTPISAAH